MFIDHWIQNDFPLEENSFISLL